jgi:hypothetical protein
MFLDLDTFSANILAPIMIIFGQFGNLFGLIVMSKKKLKKIGPQITYMAIFIIDWISFILIIQPYLLYSFNINVTLFSNLACKSYWYFTYAFATISPMLNVYISIERFISLAYPTKKYILLKNKIQSAYIIILTLFNLVLYMPIGIYFDLVDESNQTVCNFVDDFWLVTYGYLDLINRVIIPSLLMIIFSLLVIRTIFKSRNRVSNNNSHVNYKTFKKDVRFALLSILLNIFYILFSLPVSILYLFSNYWLNPLYIFFSFLYYLAYSANFYLIFSVNSLFRQEFYSLFIGSNIQKQQQQQQQQDAIRTNRKTNNNITFGARDEFSLEYCRNNNTLNR